MARTTKSWTLAARAEILKGPPHEPRREDLSDLGLFRDLPDRLVQAIPPPPALTSLPR
jgi:hypothetical protein